MAMIGHGMGLRTAHYGALLEHGPRGVDWVEIISEDYFVAGGRPWAVLDKVRAEVPVVCHGVSLGIGNTDPLDRDYLCKLGELIDRVEPAWVSDHLCWGGFGGHNAHDLLPIPYNEETLRWIAGRVAQVQDTLGRRILLENPSTYVTFAASDMSEHAFLAALAEEADCGILLDVNNIYVSAFNHGFDADVYADAIPADRIGQIHVAGYTDKGDFLLDSHIGPTSGAVWRLLKRVLQRVGPVSTLVEWDENIPPYDEVLAEVARARAIAQEVEDARAA